MVKIFKLKILYSISNAPEITIARPYNINLYKPQIDTLSYYNICNTLSLSDV